MSENASRSLCLMTGEVVVFKERHFRISQVLDFQTLIAIDLDTGRPSQLRIQDLAPAPTDAPISGRDAEFIGDDDWKLAEERYAAIKPLVDDFYAGRKAVEARAHELGIHFTTLYDWIKSYKEGGIQLLIPERRGPKKGSTRLSSLQEDVIQSVIQEYYLREQRSTPTKAVQEVKIRCMKLNIEPPSPNTVRNRINNICERDKLRRRGYKEKAKQLFQPVPGTFPAQPYPLSVVQIDHTPVDLILVDNVHRKPVGRPWLTLAMDVETRVVVGYHLSFDPPSVTSVALCVAHSILPKEDWLILHQIDAAWPVWGTMDTILVDNGAEFRSENFRRSCLHHNIRLDYRPPGTPRYGGHIERLLGNFLHQTHEIPGTTFSSIRDKDGYDAERHASISLDEFERWLITLITKIYHKTAHSELGMPPLRKWEIGIFGNGDTLGRGLPALPQNRHRVLLDFLPAFQRTVQPYGVEIDGVRYYADILRPWINARDPDHPKAKRKFIFRRDPRDISILWFFDPDLEQYFRVPFANQALPTMSIWEYREAQERSRREGMQGVNEHEILRAVLEMREITEQGAAKTKSARRKAERRRHHEKKVTPADPLASLPSEPPAPVNHSSIPTGLITGDIEAFEVE